MLQKFIKEVVNISPEYQKKEDIRQRLQEIVESLIATGDITTDEEIQDFFDTVIMASQALKAVPFAAFNKYDFKATR